MVLILAKAHPTVRNIRKAFQPSVMTWHVCVCVRDCVCSSLSPSLFRQSISVSHRTDRPLTQHHKARKPLQSLPHFSFSVRQQKGVIDLLFHHHHDKRKKLLFFQCVCLCVASTFLKHLLIIFINNTALTLVILYFACVCTCVCVHMCECMLTLLAAR